MDRRSHPAWPLVGVCALAMAAALGCDRKQPPQPTRASASPSAASSASPARPPTIEALTQRLIRVGVVLGPHAVRPGYADYKRLEESLTDTADVKRLLRHDSPVVRAYMVHYVITDKPLRLERLADALKDTANIETLDYDIGADETVGSFVFSEINERLRLDEAKPISDFCERVALDGKLPVATRERALITLWSRDEQRGQAAAKKLLDEGHGPVLATALTIFTKRSGADPYPSCLKFADNESADVRESAAWGLRASKHPGAAALLAKLAKDDDEGVRRMAAQAERERATR